MYFTGGLIRMIFWSFNIFITKLFMLDLFFSFRIQVLVTRKSDNGGKPDHK